MHIKKPEWLKVKLSADSTNSHVQKILDNFSLNTVCKEANCPNKMECFNRKTATFMILGKVCTRNCTFCNVTKGTTEQIDKNEPQNIAEAVSKLGLKHVVVTSVTRDDLSDGGAYHFANVIHSIRNYNPKVTIEVLIPDFNGNLEALDIVIDALPDVINHNVETVPALYNKVRPMAIYERSLHVLKEVKDKGPNILTKSGIMVGLGESYDEVVNVMKDLRAIDCNILTIGQYIAPSKQHYHVVEYIHPDIFEKYKQDALKLGFSHVTSSPLARSSYHADQAIKE